MKSGSAIGWRKDMILSKSASQIRARFTVPKETAAGSYLVHLPLQARK